MRLFTCAACGQTLYFENSQCTRCGHPLAFLPDHGLLAAVRADDPATGLLVPVDEKLGPDRYRPCGNQIDHEACNWAVPEKDEQRFCRACRLNQLIPNLTEPGSKDAWLKLERAKRRLLYTLLGLRLPIEPRGSASRGGLAFSFARDEPGRAEGVHGPQRRGHHHQRRRGRRAVSREDPAGAGRAVPHLARPFSPRDRPLLLGPCWSRDRSGGRRSARSSVIPAPTTPPR